MMDFYAKKYTVLMNNEPVEIWIKNDEIKKSKFMDKEVDLKNLTKETIAQIKDNPTRIVNGNNLLNNDNFTKEISKAIDAKLSLAIQKRDMKTLSRFARSDLVPEASKRDFIEAINRPRGIRGLIVRANNAINQKIQKIAAKIENFFDRTNDRLANKKLDKYLSAYQLKEFNKAPPAHALDLKKNLDAKLADKAHHFAKAKGLNDLSDLKTEDKILQEEFFKIAVKDGHTINDAKTALFKEVDLIKNHEKNSENVKTISEHEKSIIQMQETIKNLKNELHFQKLKEASKNETLEDFEVLTKNMDAVQKVDVLVDNKEYMNLSENEKLKVEDNLLVSNEKEQEQVTYEKQSKEFEEKSVATKEIANDLKVASGLGVAVAIDKLELNENWKLAQAQNRNHEIPSKKFMNLSAVKFDGVSKEKLENYKNQMDEMRAKGKNVPDAEKVNQFIDASLKNAVTLEKEGILVQTKTNEFEFKNEEQKQKLYSKEMNKEKVFELKDSLKQIASEAAIEKIIDANGEINTDRLIDYSNKLQEVSTQLQLESKANNVEITNEDLKNLNQQNTQSQSRGMERA